MSTTNFNDTFDVVLTPSTILDSIYTKIIVFHPILSMLLKQCMSLGSTYANTTDFNDTYLMGFLHHLQALNTLISKQFTLHQILNVVAKHQ